MLDPKNTAQPAELAARQAKLQKALSTAYLTHQIAELENKVKAANISDVHVPAHVPRPRAQQQTNASGAHNDKLQAGNASDVMIAPRDPNDDLGRAADVEDPDDNDEVVWRVVVVDVSALMWARNAVKRLVQKGWEIVVPLEAIRTLDLLKKGSSASAVAARQAARYIEHASRFHQPISSNPSFSIQRGTNYRKGRGLRIQREDEIRPVDTLLDELALPPLDGEASLSSWVEAVFTCVAFFKWIGDSEEVEGDGQGHGYEKIGGPVLYVANPPVFVEVSQGRSEPTPAAREGDDIGDFDDTARGEGHVILQEAARFDVPLEVLRDDDVELEASTFGRSRVKGANTGGRGRGRDGRDGKGKGRKRADGQSQGRGEKKDPEPEREVKILLRRQPASSAAPGEAEAEGAASFPSPESGKSTLPSGPSAPSPALAAPHLHQSGHDTDFPPPFASGMLGRPPPGPGHHRGRGFGHPHGRGGHGWGFRPPPPPPMDANGFPALGATPPPPPPPPSFGRPPPPPSPSASAAQPSPFGPSYVHMRPPPPPDIAPPPPHNLGRPPPSPGRSMPFEHDRGGPPPPFDPEVPGRRGGHGGRGRGHGHEHERGIGHREGARGRGGSKHHRHGHGVKDSTGGGGGFTLLQRPDRPSSRDLGQGQGQGKIKLLARPDSEASASDRRPKSQSRAQSQAAMTSTRVDEPKVILLQRPK